MADTIATSAAGDAAPELASLATKVSNVDLSSTSRKDDDTSSTLSRRGAAGASGFDLPEGVKRLLANQYDPITNPDGIINAGIADNSLCRPELLEYFLAKDRLQLSAADLTYADRFTSSKRLLTSIAKLFNERTPDWPERTDSPLPLKKVTEDHIAIASGATGILDELFWNICDDGDGVLLSAPYYNAFDNDLTSRAKARVVEVHLPLPAEGEESKESLELSSFASSTIAAYREAYERAKKEGIPVKALILCNPHNPTGTIYPRSTVLALARFAGEHQLHFVSDEIYARSCFTTSDVPSPARFESILSIDTQKECGLDPAYVHVVTSASKDFAVNGFRLGVLVSQHNPALQRAMSSVGLLSQSASPAANLWHTWLQDEKFLAWYLRENRRRLGLAYEHALAWFKHYQVPYYPSNSGFFLLVNLGQFCGIDGDSQDKEGREMEAKFVDRLLDEGVFVAPGTQYHHPKAGWFRFTFSMEPKTLTLALRRLEKATRVEGSFEEGRALLDLGKGREKVSNEGAEGGKSWLQKISGR
ncbi:Aminotransferase, class I/classII [Kalmanozyma brasiliensis GHG001]|uniref:Aminotransferase class I/classII large domain-containing protein n=1 Tax=Kalmanozyma brasiliensis (strain GHG001) TaxID=1365824 RepID=V5EZB3_KALBG|nr:Aminotransferase, class I/classII [Kalmanozyma brasiliensis GHG001]EST08184.1 Aminotransferase, class I/classII [Kalmanozyma brasiliensis GHG001]